MNQAWDIYVIILERIDKFLQQSKSLKLLIELSYVSPCYFSTINLQLTIPGFNQIKIQSFIPKLQIIESKQRPRKLKIRGSNGLEYSFLLKGHEDLRQDKRVMQLFNLINTLFKKKSLQTTIRGYQVIPLSANTGVLEWMNNTDTMHDLIKEYRDNRNVLLNIEHKLMLTMAPDFNKLTAIQKLEVFNHAMSRTTGLDLAHILWLKSNNSEEWLHRRTNFTSSLATMSMVEQGYILGLGDRHHVILALIEIQVKLYILGVVMVNFEMTTNTRKIKKKSTISFYSY